MRSFAKKCTGMMALIIILLVPHKSAIAADKNASLLAADHAFAALSEKNGMKAAFSAFLADDAIMLPGAGPAVEGKGLIAGGFPPPEAGVSLLWKPMHAEVGPSGAFGYTWGTYEMRGAGQNGTPFVRRGKYVNVWRKVNDTWRVILDMGNVDPR